MLCSQAFFSHLLLSPLENHSPSIQVANTVEHQNSAIYVLAAFANEDLNRPLVDQMSEIAIARLTYAYMLYKKQTQPIVLSGGKFNKKLTISYAEAAANFLLVLGVNENDLVLVHEGHDTFSEIQATRSHLQQYEYIHVITNAAHTYRVSYILNMNSIEKYSIYPVAYWTREEYSLLPNWPDIESLDRTRAAFYEYLAIVKMYVGKLFKRDV